METEKIYNSKELKELPVVISLMPPCIVNGYDKRFAVYTGTTGSWIRITQDVTLDDVRSIWQKWEPVKTEEQKRFEAEKPQSWEILASNKKSTYTVTLSHGNFSCSCVGFGFYKKCKHIEEAKKKIIA
jgi:hypothetical protein